MLPTSKRYLGIIGIVIIFLIYFFHQVFLGLVILPQFFLLGALTIRYYGLFMALAVAVGFYLATKRSSQYGLTNKQAEDILFYTIIGGFVGARLYHVASSWQFYLNNPLDIFKVWNGGLSIYGVIFGGVVTLFILNKFNSPQPPLLKRGGVLELLNWLTPSLIVGQIIGRFGNFFNYELYGYPTNLPWKMFVPGLFRETVYQSQNFFHPLFLYEQIGLFAILIAVFKISETKNQKSLFLWYILLYNVLRFGLEFLRIDSVFWGYFRVNALVSLLLASFCAIYLTYDFSKRMAT